MFVNCLWRRPNSNRTVCERVMLAETVTDNCKCSSPTQYIIGWLVSQVIHKVQDYNIMTIHRVLTESFLIIEHIYRRIWICQDGHLDQSEAYDIS